MHGDRGPVHACGAFPRLAQLKYSIHTYTAWKPSCMHASCVLVDIHIAPETVFVLSWTKPYFKSALICLNLP